MFGLNSLGIIFIFLKTCLCPLSVLSLRIFLGSEATQRIYDSDIEKSKDYIHNYAEYLRHYKSPINRNKSDKSLLNDINESND